MMNLRTLLFKGTLPFFHAFGDLIAILHLRRDNCEFALRAGYGWDGWHVTRKTPLHSLTSGVLCCIFLVSGQGKSCFACVHRDSSKVLGGNEAGG